MKKFLILVILLTSGPICYANEGDIEIYCEAVQTITYKQRIVKNYSNFGFFIDDNSKKLYFAPSHNDVGGNVIIFDEDAIYLKDINAPTGMSGDLSINRNSGAFRINFVENKKILPAHITHTGNCSKVSAQNKF